MSAAAPRLKSRHRGIYYREDDRGRRRWIVWFKDSEGKGRYETLPEGSSENDALVRQAELRGKKSRGERVVPSKITLRDFAEAWFELHKGRWQPKTQSAYRWGLTQAYEHIGKYKRLSDLTVDDVAQMVIKMEQDGKSPDSIKNAFTPLSRMFAYAIRKGVRGDNPVKALDKSERPKTSAKKMRILTSEEIELVIARTPELFRTAVATAIFTGLRIGELLELRWSDVDFKGGLVTVRESKTEAGRGRRVVLMPALGARLRAHKLASSFSADEDLVFASGRGNVISQSNLRRRGLNAALAAVVDDEGVLQREEIPHARFHDLRHTFASMLIGQGLDVTFVADQLGHKDPAITLRIYAKLFDPVRRRDEARVKLETAFGGMV